MVATRDLAVTVTRAAMPEPARVNLVAPTPPDPGRGPFRNYGRTRPAAGDVGKTAATLLAERSEDIARFLREKGVTKLRLDPLEALESAVRRRGYSLVRLNGGYVVDDRIDLPSTQALDAFARRRGIEIPVAA